MPRETGYAGSAQTKGASMSVEFTVISIGTLSHNRLWGE